MLGEQRDADTGVDVQRDVGDLERALERHPQAQTGRARRGLVAGRQHDGKLVAAEARQHVVGAQQLRQPRPDLLQDLVTGVMAQGVVELLEAVEVDQQQRELPTVLVRGTDSGMKALHEVPSIGEARQVIGERLLLALPQPLGHGEPGTCHPGQHRDRRDGDRHVVDRLELPDRQQRERGRGEHEDRDEHDGAELGARLGGLGAVHAAAPRASAASGARSAPAPNATRPTSASTTGQPGRQRLSARPPITPAAAVAAATSAPTLTATAADEDAPIVASSQDRRDGAATRSSTNTAMPAIASAQAATHGQSLAVPVSSAVAAHASAAANTNRPTRPEPRTVPAQTHATLPTRSTTPVANSGST